MLSDQDIANLAASYWSGKDTVTAVAVALAESRGDTQVTHHNLDGSTDYGLWQVNSVHGYPTSQLLDPSGNARAAHEVWQRANGSWTPWSAYKSGAYLLYLPQANAVASKASPSATTDIPIEEPSNPLTSVAHSLTVLIDGAKWVSNPHNWVRVAEVTVGGALVLGGLAVVASTSKAGKLATKVVK